MLRRHALAIAVLSLPGCFSDGGGGNLTQTVTSLEPASSTSSTSGPTDATTTTGAPDPTSSGSSTTTLDEPTGSSSTTTTAPLCPGEMQCTPGEVMTTDSLCDPCGRLARTCQPDCTWGADECVEDLSSCAYWYYEGGWTRVALPQPVPEHAPTAPAIAAFDLANHGRIFVLTADSFHVLQRSDHTWVASGALTDLLPGLPGPLLQAYAVDNGDGTYVVYAVGDPQAWLYTMPALGTQASLAQVDNCCNSWTGLVNPGSQAAVRDIYIDLASPFPWTGGEFYAPCIDQLVPLGSYAAWVTATDVYVQDVAYCFQMIQAVNHAMFTPLAAAGAPPGDLIGGVALLGERLYVFAGE